MKINETSIVYAFKCEDYNVSHIYNLVKESIEDMGGFDLLFKKESKILLKPNLLAPDSPKTATTTHPTVFEAVAKLLLDNGFKVTYGDSPSFHSMETVLKKSGLKNIGNKLGIKTADFLTGKKTFVSEAKQNKYFTIANAVFESDFIISISKLKTHAFTTLTGAIKNQFGCIPGRTKSSYHVKLDDVDKFSQMLVDLTIFLRPKLYVMDAILAMEGNGPRRGNPVKLGALLISTDPVALDTVASKIIGIKPSNVKTSVKGQESGLGSMENFEIRGNLDGSTIKKFKLPKRDPFTSLPKGIRKAIENFTIPKPVFDYNKCIKCHECYNICPTEPKSIFINNENYPVYIYKTCIKCYCCLENCPTGAIHLKLMPFRR